MKMRVCESFSFRGDDVHLVSESKIGFIAGGQIVIQDLEFNKREIINSSDFGFAKMTTCYKRSLIAAVEYGISPRIIIYNTMIEGIEQKISGAIELDVHQMVFSFDGKRLAIVKGCPEYTVSLVTIEENKEKSGKLLGEEEPWTGDILKIVFSPFTNDSFVVLRKSTITLCNVIWDYEGEPLQKSYKLSRKLFEWKGEESDGELTTLVWDHNNVILAGATNGAVLFLNSETLQEIRRMNTYTHIKFILPTIKYLIFVNKEWNFKFFLNNEETSMPVEAEGDKPTREYQFSQRQADLKSLFFNQAYNFLVANDSRGKCYTIGIEAEQFEDLKDDMDPDEDHVEHKIIADVSEKLQGHTDKVAFVCHSHSNSLISGGADGQIIVWDLENKSNLKSRQTQSEFSCGSLLPPSKGTILLTGTELGALKVYDISDFRSIALVARFRLNEKKKIQKILVSENGSIYCVVIMNSKKLYIGSGDSKKGFALYGHVKLASKILDVSIAETGQSPLQLKSCIFECLLASSIVVAVVIEWDKIKPDLATTELTDESIVSFYARRVDPDLQILAVHKESGDLLMVGQDRILKRYKQPDKPIAELNMKKRTPPEALEKVEAMSLLCSMIKCNDSGLILAGEDGCVQKRPVNNLGQVTEARAQSLHQGGVSCIHEISKELLVAGGFDGSISFVGSMWLYEADEVSSASRIKNKLGNEELVEGDDLEIKHQRILSLDAFNESQKERRETKKRETRNALKAITAKLHTLLRTNEAAEPVERLERDEFCIDNELRDRLLKAGEEEAVNIRVKASHENMKQEILRQRIKMMTWDKMETQLKTITAISGNLIIFNFHVRKPTQAEIRKLNLVRGIRKMELREAQWRSENNKSELVPHKLVGDLKEPYIVNLLPGKPRLILIDFEKLLKPEEKEEAGPGQGGRLGGKSKAGGLRALRAIKDPAQDEKTAAEEKKAKEAIQAEDTTDWDMLYGAYELFTPTRKRNQCILIKNVILKLKQDFNREFESLLNFRNTQLDLIGEKNQKIKEISEELSIAQDVFIGKPNLIEMPQEMLEIKKGDLKVEKYLTREERQKLEEERLKEEERLRILAQDDAGIRALKLMMGNTLAEKKENKLEEELVKEEWMSKPREQMTEDEKGKFDDFLEMEAQLNEEKEKIRKGLEQEMRKLRNEISEISEHFDKRLQSLFIKRLEVLYRIQEQELYLAKINHSLIESKFKGNELKAAKEELEQLAQKHENFSKYLNQVMSKRDNITSKKQQIEGKIENESARAATLMQIFEPLRPLFDDKRNKDVIGDLKIIDSLVKRVPIYEKMQVELDPYRDVDLTVIKKENEYNFETYDEYVREAAKRSRGEQTNPEKIRDFFNRKVKLLHKERRFQTIMMTVQKAEKMLADAADAIDFARGKVRDYQDDQMFSMSDLDIQFRFKRSLVEIPLKNPIPTLDDVILIYKRIIKEQNECVNKMAQEKEAKLKAVLEDRYKVEKLFYDVKLNWLDIEDKLCEAKDITRLKVTKPIQVALAKKDLKMAEREETNFKNQIESLKTATKLTVEDLAKREKIMSKEINFLKKENDRLNREGVKLEENVSQRQEIGKMMNSKQSSSRDASAALLRFKEIAYNRKLYDLAKKQAEEIELLMEELKRLKAKSFANLPNSQPL